MKGLSAAGLGGLLMIAVLSTSLAGQTVTFSGRGDLRTDSRIRSLLTRADYRVLYRDTVVAPGDTLVGHVLILGATVRLENVVRGDLTIIDANVFLRPGAHVTGDVLSINAGLFRAPASAIDGIITELKDAPYRAEVRIGEVRVRGMREPSLLDPDGLRGLLPPTWDRVNGLGLHGGGRLLLPALGPVEPEIHVRADYHGARERGGGSVEIGVRTAGGFHAGLGAARVPVTREAWFRGDFTNSVSFLVLGEDVRNYYDAERLWIALDQTFPHESGTATLEVRAQVENAATLVTRDTWHAWGDDPARANPAIDEGRIASLLARAAADWIRPTFTAALDGLVERAVSAADGEFTFTGFELGGEWAMRALANHTYRLKARFRGPLPGSDPMPRQRWSGLGGPGTLTTLDPLELNGDRLLFVASAYSIPVPGIDLPALGPPAVELVHTFGSAWSRDAADALVSGRRDLTHNLGLRLRFRIGWIMGVTDPSDSRSFALTAGFARPLRFPWTPREYR